MRVLLTEKWGPAAPFLQCWPSFTALYPVEAADLQAIQRHRKKRPVPKNRDHQEDFRHLALAAAVFLFQRRSPLRFSAALTAVFSMLVTMIVMKRLFFYRMRDQIWI
jgi:hypothetical protein